jgi:hypothetical protein
MVKLQIIVPVRGLSWAEIERELRACFEVCPPHAVTIDYDADDRPVVLTLRRNTGTGAPVAESAA